MDSFVYCSAERLAPDLPVPVLNIENKIFNPGMASNVKRNLEALRVDVDIVTNENWKDILKVRYVHLETNHLFFRVDSKFNPKPLKSLPNLEKYIAIIISDYNKGFLSRELIQQICNAHSLVFLDTKKVIDDWAVGATFIKINDYEYQRSLPTMSLKLKKKVIHTLGMRGAEYKGKTFSVDKVEVRDSSGAGDSFLAALVAEYVLTYNIESSIRFANKVASKIVTMRGVGVFEK